MDEKYRREDALAIAAGDLVKCQRLHSMVRPSFCAKYRENNEICRGCPQIEDMDRLAADRHGVKRLAVAVPIEQQTEQEEAVANRACLDCKDPEKRIIGRGLCGGCYHRHKKAGTLDEKYPTLGFFGGAQEKAVEEDQTEEPAKEFGDRGIEEAQSEALEESIEGPADETKRPAPNLDPGVPLQIHFAERDQDLLAYLEDWADDQRRSIEDQILFVLDNIVAERVRGESNV